MPPTDALTPILLVAHLAAAGALVPVVRALSPPDRRAFGVAAIGAVLTVALGLLVRDVVPVWALSPVREGFTEAHLDAIGAVGLHAGPLVRASSMPALLPSGPVLRDVVGLDLGATLAVAWGLGVLAWRLLGDRVLVPLLIAAFLAAPGTWSSALGETEAPIVTLLALAGVPAFVVLCDGTSTRAAAGAAIVALVLLTGLGALGRAEVLALGASAIGGGLLARTSLGARLEARASACVDAVGRHWVVGLAALVAWGFVAERVLPVRQVDLRTFGQATWALWALDPLDDRALTLPLVLVAALPVGIVLLALLGAAGALRAPLRHAGLPLVLLWWQGTWWLAAHGGLHGQARSAALGELWRYALLATPWVVVLAALGLRALPTHDRRVRVAAAIALLLPAIPPVAQALRPEPAGVTTPLVGPVTASAADEVRALLAGWEARPGCAIVTRGLPWGEPATSASYRWSAVVPFRGGARVFHADVPVTAEPDAVLAALHVDVPCVVAWQGLDCGALTRDGVPVGIDGCGALTGWPALDVTTWRVRPWVHVAHGLRWPEEVEVGWRAVPGRTAR